MPKGKIFEKKRCNGLNKNNELKEVKTITTYYYQNIS